MSSYYLHLNEINAFTLLCLLARGIKLKPSAVEFLH
jgi:hypothetical protein